jgi:hypothetical protein
MPGELWMALPLPGEIFEQDGYHPKAFGENAVSLCKPAEKNVPKLRDVEMGTSICKFSEQILAGAMSLLGAKFGRKRTAIRWRWESFLPLSSNWPH